MDSTTRKTPRKITKRPARVRKPKLEEIFYAFIPDTDTEPRRLMALLSWSGFQHGPSLTRQRYAVCSATIIDSVIVASMSFTSAKDAKVRYDEMQQQLKDFEVSVVTARDHLEQITGQRFRHCLQCHDTLDIGALWCTQCGAADKDRPITAAEHAAAVAAKA